MKIGSQVTREVYLDDGTWARQGDKCLKHSPLKIGEITKIDGRLYTVKWKDGTQGVYLKHGINYLKY